MCQTFQHMGKPAIQGLSVSFSKALVIIKLSILTSLIVVCASKKSRHLVKEENFPPKVPFKDLNPFYVERFDEIMVIGDVHGCLTELELLLKKANVTGSNVLKILTGDFLRKGPKSAEVLRFIRHNPSILSVRGNNDQEVLTMQYKVEHFDHDLSRGDEFIEHMTQKDVEFVRDLPYAITIPSLNAIIVHAGLRPGLPLEQQDIVDLMNIKDVVRDDEWIGGYRPTRKGSPWASKWYGPQHVYFGHNHPRNLQLYPLATGVDTSCVFGNYLTGVFIKGPRKGQLVQQKALRYYV